MYTQYLMYAHTHTHGHEHAYTHTHTHTHTCSFLTCTHTGTHMHTHTRTCTHTHTRKILAAFSHAHTCTQILGASFKRSVTHLCNQLGLIESLPSLQFFLPLLLLSLLQIFFHLWIFSFVFLSNCASFLPVFLLIIC